MYLKDVVELLNPWYTLASLILAFVICYQIGRRFGPNWSVPSFVYTIFGMMIILSVILYFLDLEMDPKGVAFNYIFPSCMLLALLFFLWYTFMMGCRRRHLTAE